MDSRRPSVYTAPADDRGTSVTDLKARIFLDKEAILQLLSRDPVSTAYMLGDLDADFDDVTTWYGAERDGRLVGVLLFYTGLSLPAILTWGDPDAIGKILAAFGPTLPGRTIMHLPPAHVAAAEQVFDLDDLKPMWRMGVMASDFIRATDAPELGEVVRLGHRDTGELMALFQHYPDNFFEPAQLDTGYYCGIRIDEHLVSLAGVHVVSPSHEVACLGNIVTHPDYRGRGLSTRCTSHLCEQLVSDGVSLLALNVARENRSAIRVYEKLGFRQHAMYLEGTAHKPLMAGVTAA